MRNESNIPETAMAILQNGRLLWSNDEWRAIARSNSLWALSDEASGDVLYPLFALAQEVLHDNPQQRQIRLRCMSQDWQDAMWELKLERLPSCIDLYVLSLSPEAFGQGPATAHRNLLIVDDEESILNALRRLLRHRGFNVHTVVSGADALALLEREPIDVVISDQRMPGMTGVDFLRKVRERWPDTVRIVLSGYTDLQSVTDAINEGAIYKFITKPWEDARLVEALTEAFRLKHVMGQNMRLQLELTTLSRKLEATNRNLSDQLEERERRIDLDEHSLSLVHDIFSSLPFPVLGVDLNGMVALTNDSAEHHLGSGLLGNDIASILNHEALTRIAYSADQPCVLDLPSGRYLAWSRDLIHTGLQRGQVMAFLPDWAGREMP